MELLKSLENKVEEEFRKWSDVGVFCEIKSKIDSLPPDKKKIALSHFLSLLKSLELYQTETLGHIVAITEILESCGIDGDSLEKIASILFG